MSTLPIAGRPGTRARGAGSADHHTATTDVEKSGRRTAIPPGEDRFVRETKLNRSAVASSAGRLSARVGDSANGNSRPTLRGRMRRGLGGARNAEGPNAGVSPGYDGNPRTSLVDAAKVLKNNLDRLDGAAGGRKDGKFGLQDLEAVAADPRQPFALRNAAQAVLADPNKLNALDVAGGARVDRRFSAKDLDAVITEGEQNSGGMTLEQVTEILGRNAALEQGNPAGGTHFDVLDAAKTGKKDGKISREDCRIVADDPNANDELRAAARALLENDNLFNALDVANGDRRDGKFSLEDLKNVKVSPTPEPGRQWGAQDEKALNDVLQSGGPFTDLYGGVRQTDRGNCASTAVIKAAMDTYGVDVFSSVEKLPRGGYAVEMQDGTRIELNRAELEAAATGAHFEGNEAGTRAFANLAYAAMAKRAQMLGHEGAQTYAEALRSLANGEQTKQVPRYLGLSDKVKYIDVDQIQDHDGVVAWGNGHAVFVDEKNGAHFTDAWGQARAFDGTNEVNKPNNALQYAFYFAD